MIDRTVNPLILRANIHGSRALLVFGLLLK